jgi:hypothetical protein
MKAVNSNQGFVSGKRTRSFAAISIHHATLSIQRAILPHGCRVSFLFSSSPVSLVHAPKTTVANGRRRLQNATRKKHFSLACECDPY